MYISYCDKITVCLDLKTNQSWLTNIVKNV